MSSGAGSPRRAQWLAGAAWAVARRPGLWRIGIRQLGRLAGPGWWRRPPFLPVPDRDYLEFRLRTMYGSALSGIDSGGPHDVVAYLRWCEQMEASRYPRRQ